MPPITGLSVTLNRTNYSRYEAARSVIKATVKPTGDDPGSVTVVLVAPRLSGPSVIKTQIVQVAGTPVVATFDLRAIVDEYGFMLARRSYAVDDYRVTATLDSDSTISDSAFCTVTLITVEEMRTRWMVGLSLQTTEKLTIRAQPVVVTGVHINDVIPGTTHGPGTLAFVFASMTLSWNGGPPVPITGLTEAVLSDTVGGGLYVTIDPPLLPTADATEILYVDYGRMSDAAILAEVMASIDYVEHAIRVYIEPMYVVTRILLDPTINYDVPIGEYDVITDGLTWYKPPDPMRWLSLKLMHRPLQKLFHLTGYFNKTKTVTIPFDWITWTKKSSFVELVPSNLATIPWIFYGPGFYTFIATSNAVPQFWQYYAVCGLESCPPVIRDHIAKRAAITLLTQAGLARLPSGATGRSISRDGVSESLSIMPGVYRGTIEQYERELGRDGQGNEKGLQSLLERYVGFDFVTL